MVLCIEHDQIYIVLVDQFSVVRQAMANGDDLLDRDVNTIRLKYLTARADVVAWLLEQLLVNFIARRFGIDLGNLGNRCQIPLEDGFILDVCEQQLATGRDKAYGKADQMVIARKMICDGHDRLGRLQDIFALGHDRGGEGGVCVCVPSPPQDLFREKR